ncbi:cytokine receptor common subunit gamma [Kryptolebias marmoratus]|uniref:cytokine receptor common subunit gamma n=1 Tax=Kryptolebias marmoratus TaxID=37003 RepID=UPI000D52FAFE|nr:cytokine receptor common subunit gamma [Kryptolebias marmoratus]
MTTQLLLLLCLIGQVLAKNPPEVKCVMMNLENVHCSWKQKQTPEVNYTFSSWFFGDDETICTEYLVENSINVGCFQPTENGNEKRFLSFYTVLKHGSEPYKQEHQLKSRVKLNPPTNLSVKNGSDFNLWFYWNQTRLNTLNTACVQYEVQYRTNNNNWESSDVAPNSQSYSIKYPSSSSRYELQVRSRITDSCGKSEIWSDWSEPVVWGSNMSPDGNINEPMAVWPPVLYALGAITLILLVLILLRYERLRIILIPVVPKPSLNSSNIEFSKGLMKDDFIAKYTEQACIVSEDAHASRSNSISSNSSDLTRDPSDSPVLIAEKSSEELSSPSDAPSEEEQVFV